MSNFFILGLPRSRTTWLSAFLYNTQVFCGHEVFSYKDWDGADFWKIGGYEYRGSVDNDPRYAKPYLQDLEAPLVIIDRHPQTVYKSLVGKYRIDRKEAKHAIYSMCDSLEEAKKSAELIINFKQLDSKLPELMELCMPNIGYDKVKHELFKNTNIQQKVNTLGDN